MGHFTTNHKEPVRVHFRFILLRLCQFLDPSRILVLCIRIRWQKITTQRALCTSQSAQSADLTDLANPPTPFGGRAHWIPPYLPSLGLRPPRFYQPKEHASGSHGWNQHKEGARSFGSERVRVSSTKLRYALNFSQEMRNQREHAYRACGA